MFVALFITGCSETKNPVQEDLLNYINVELPKIAPIEEKVSDGYSSVTGDNYKDDLTTYNKISTDVVKDSLELIDISESITPKTSEVQAVHEIYIKAVNTQHSAFTMIMAAIDTQDASKMSTANEKLSEARAGMRDYIAKIKALAAENDVEFENEE